MWRLSGLCRSALSLDVNVIEKLTLYILINFRKTNKIERKSIPHYVNFFSPWFTNLILWTRRMQFRKPHRIFPLKVLNFLLTVPKFIFRKFFYILFSEKIFRTRKMQLLRPCRKLLAQRLNFSLKNHQVFRKTSFPKSSEITKSFILLCWM